MKFRTISFLCMLIAVLLFICALPQSANAASENDLTFTKRGKTYIVSDCDQAAVGEIVIPATYNGLPVTGIGDYAFQTCTQLTGITIPDSVTSIGLGAFEGCFRLTGIVIPNSVTRIGMAAFFGCSGLTDMVISESVTVISESLFGYCSSLTGVTIPDGVTRIDGYAFTGCSELSSVVIPDGVTHIGEYAFSNCKKLTDVTIPNGVTSIGQYAFVTCSSMTSVFIPESVTHIGVWGFNWCSVHVDENNPVYSSDSQGVLFNKDKTVLIHARGAVGEDYVIPNGVKEISDWAFFGCSNLKSLTVPVSVTDLGDYAFHKCSGLTDVYFTGTEQQWYKLRADPGEENSPLFRNTVHYDHVMSINSLEVSADRANLCLSVGDSITLRARVVDDQGQYTDPSGITFQVTDSSLVDVVRTGFEEDSFYIQLRGVNPGTITVTFSDASTGHTVAVPVTVFENSYPAYSLGNVPEISSFGRKANFANMNGLYIDSYSYKINGDQSARVTFDVYNTNYSYGVVLVYTQEGELYNAVLINRMVKHNTSVKEVYWDGTICMVQALFSEDYRGGFYSIKTHVEVDVPQNGYIKITCDSADSGVLALVNYSHLLLSALSLVDKVENFDKAEVYYSEELLASLANLKEMTQTAAIAQFRKDGHTFFTNIMKDEVKELTITAETLGDFIDTLSKQMLEFKGMELITKSLLSSGVDFAEDVFAEMAGRFGAALKAVFAIGSVENLVINYHDIAYTTGGGTIIIQNQGGGIRAATQIKLESEVIFDPDVALQAYCVAIDGAFLEFVQKADQETYEILMKSICHVYNISLLKGEEEVQHSDYVTVYIPIPEDLRVLSLSGNVSVYRIEEDGSLTDMDAVLEDGCMRFVTNHFSLYVLVGNEEASGGNCDAGHNMQETPAVEPTCTTAGKTAASTCANCGKTEGGEEIPAKGHVFEGDTCTVCGQGKFVVGDANGDGKINLRDAILVLQASNGKDVAVDRGAADVTGDGKMNIRDAILILKRANGNKDPFPSEK